MTRPAASASCADTVAPVRIHYIAFVLPIILRLRAGESFERTAWNLGRWYKVVDWIAILWIVFICLIFMLPAFQGGIPFKSNFLWLDFNYTPLPVFGTFLLFGGWYLLSARKWFKGPIRQGSAEELAQIEAGFESPGTPATSPAGRLTAGWSSAAAATRR